MLWHERSCGIPDLLWTDGYPNCIRCGASASSITNGAMETPPLPAPPPSLKRSQLRCSWPPCVEYSGHFIDGDGNDLTEFIIENIDGWNIDATDLLDDQVKRQEVRGAPQRTDGSSEALKLPRVYSNTTYTDAADGVTEITHNKPHTAVQVPTSTQRPDRIHENICGPDDFRVLRLYGSTSSDDPIHCSLEVAQLDDPDGSLYEALSYTWADLDGDKRNCMPIYIGSHFDVLLVTKNCQSALRRLRKRFDRLLWIDAICINQNDPIERSAQVNHMSEIYSRASRVLIYLGEWSKRSEEALPNVTKCVQTSATREDTTSLVKLAKRPYFKRLWVIQEVARADRASVVCGDLVMHWKDLCSALESCGAAPEWIKHFSAPLNHRREAPSVSELLRDTKDALCIDPRDKLFGIIGLANTEERELLPTDYSLSVQQLYIGLAAYLVQKTDDRSFLKLADGQRKIIPGLPSWVPDWTNIETQESGAMMPELLVGSPYAAFSRLFWRNDAVQIPVFGGSSIIASVNKELKPLRNMDLLLSPPLVQHAAGAILPYAVPLFRISRGELMTHGVASGMRATNWRMHPGSRHFNQTDELEIFAIPTLNAVVILKKHSAGIFSLGGCVSVIPEILEEQVGLNELSRRLSYTIRCLEICNLQRWLCVVLGLHLASNLASHDPAEGESTHKAAVFPHLAGLRDAENSLRERYQTSDQIGFNSGHFEAMKVMRSIMVDAIDPEDLACDSEIRPDIFTGGRLKISLDKVQSFAEELPARQKSIEEQISTWSSSIAQLRAQLQEQGSFSDAFRDLEADSRFGPIYSFYNNHSNLLKKVLGVSQGEAHLSLFLQKAYSVISRATLDKNLPWDYNRDRFWMCIISFDLIVRLRLLLADRQLYTQMGRSIRSSMENPKRIVIV